MPIQQSKPDGSQLLSLKQDRVFKWLLDQLNTTFPRWPSNMPAKTLEDNHLKAGQQQVLQRIKELLGDEI